MADPYYPYPTHSDRGSNFPGYLSSEAPPLDTHHVPVSTEFHSASSELIQREPGSSGFEDNVSGVRVYRESGIGGANAAASLKGYSSPLEDKLPNQRGDALANISSAIPDVVDGSNTLRNADGASVSRAESNVLFVDRLPTDCTRREVGHLFRPFIGYKDIKVIHKEPRRKGDKAMVLCFVEFADAKCALTAMEALQGYKFDDKKPDSPALKIHFAHFPFRLPSDHEDQHFRIPH